MMYVTRGLVDVLLGFAAEAEPEELTVSLAVTPAGQLDGTEDLPPDAPVFTHFYPPDAGKSITAVFGVDLSVPAGQTQGRFIAHPKGNLEVNETDDLHEAILVAVPPWDESSVAAFDRSGRKQPLEVLDAQPPTESLS
ncbi:hypothetical protein M0R88_17325 [Halorussus gelatinilyticus]|uniref:Uncharacterized protein n=1 Tax=Halorussus gelatinilyticus TaxID=2937524 RepID=A0A8U0IGQ6_9EURY|nr:hypothetical protein [Halorussus gelatinilyticus]UPW00257.1 hypothetical protein M0R88_17325 [Halorussus gelatinilyticus]